MKDEFDEEGEIFTLVINPKRQDDGSYYSDNLVEVTESQLNALIMFANTHINKHFQRFYTINKVTFVVDMSPRQDSGDD